MSTDLFSPPQRGTLPTLEHLHPARLLPVEQDIRTDRSSPEYRDFFDRLVADLRERGVQVPIIAFRNGDSNVTLDGETRRLGSLMAGLESVPVLVYEEKPKDVKLASLLANSMRRGMTDQELAPLYQQLMQENGWGQADLAKAIHVSASKVSKVLAISSKLPADLQAMVSAGTLPARAAYALSKLSDVDKQRELAEKVVKGLLKVESLEEHVAKLSGKKAKKEKPVKLSLCGVTVILSVFDPEKIAAALVQIDGALKKREKHALPWSAMPQLVKG